MTEADVYETLTELFRDIFVRDDIVLGPDIAAADIDGWDSYKQIEILIAVEQRYGVKLKTREAEKLNNVGDLVRIIVDKTGSS